MKKLVNYISIALLTWIAFGCTDEQIVNHTGTELRVTGEIESPSRTIYTETDKAVTVSWAAGDRIGLFSEEQPEAMAYQAASEGKQTEFTPESIRLKKKEGTEAYAFYPFDYYTDITYPYAPLPYLFGQNYNGGLPDPTADFMYAKATVENGMLELDFTHLFAFLKVNIRTELLKDAQGLFVSSNEPIAYWALNGNFESYYDMKADTLVAEKCNYLWYYFPEEALDTQETITCYIAVLPTSEQNVVSFFIYNNNGSTEQGLIEKQAPEGGFQAGHVYDLSVNENEFDKIIQQEREALIALYEATGGDNWTDNTNWCSDKPLSEWYGVVFGDGHVKSIYLTNNNLTGQLPEELGKLTALENLSLGWNNLTGNIPEYIGNLTTLTNLDLSLNALEGSIPESIGNLTALKSLYLDSNKLDGSIPESIGNLTALTDLNLRSNKLTGNIPENIGHLTALTYLSLNSNNLTGKIPECIGNLTALTDLDLMYNSIEGNIPKSIGNLTALKSLALFSNKLGGSIPESIGNLTVLTYLNLSSNNLTGNLPASMANLNKLEYIDVCSNKLSGVIPNEIVNCDWWNRLGYSQIIYQQEGYKLTFPMYESSDYSMDGTVITLQKHTAGKGLKVVIMGEAYSDRLIADGTYRKDAEIAMEAFFSEEPYTSFRNYFDVYALNVVSQNEVIGENTAFQTSYEFDRNTFETNPTIAIDYILGMAETDYSTEDITSVVLMNTKAYFRSNCWMYSDGFSAAFCANDGNKESLEQLVHHEACGHGFAKLDDEYTEFEGTYPYPETIIYNHTINESMNVDVTDNPNEVVWNYFLTDMRYEKEKIGIYEGAVYYPKGVYRATENSIMRYNTGGFNAPSRQSIYRRIMEKSGGVYRFEDFLEYDEINRQRIEAEGASRSGGASIRKTPLGLPPVKFDYPASEAKKYWKQRKPIQVPFR